MNNFVNQEEQSGVVENKQKTRLWSVIAFVVSILSVVLCFVPWLGITFGVASIILCLVSRINLGYFDRFGIASLFIGIFGLVFSVGAIIMEYIITIL